MKRNVDTGDIPRRQFLLSAAWAAAAAVAAPLRSLAEGTETQPFGNGVRELIAYPQKRPLMRITTRPPHLETPFSVFNDGAITSSDAFFVRYHLANIPLSVDLASYRLKIGGKVTGPLSLSMQEIKSLAEPVEVVAVNQCSGNSRGFSNPRVFGAQLGNGSMGNARWTGVPLKAVLDKAGVGAIARQVTFNGLDTPVLPATSDFIKVLDVDLAMSPDVILAWAMNGADIPMLNGYPVKLIVPGYYGTYWVKHLSDIEVVESIFDGFWMSAAYRVPDNPTHSSEPGETVKVTVPISRFNVRSFITSLADGAKIPAGRETIVRGIAFDGGDGIREVAFSADDGQSWRAAS